MERPGRLCSPQAGSGRSRRLLSDGRKVCALWQPRTEEGILDDGEAWLVGSYGMGDLEELEPSRLFAVYYTSDRDQAPWIQQAILSR